MKPLIEKMPKIGASVKTTRNQSMSYTYIINSNYIYPYHGIFKIQNGEYFTINISHPIYRKIAKEGTSIPINSIEDINILKYIINELY